MKCTAEKLDKEQSNNRSVKTDFQTEMSKIDDPAFSGENVPIWAAVGIADRLTELRAQFPADRSPSPKPQ